MARYRTLLVFAGVAGPLAYLYHPVFVDLAAQWSIDTTFGYGYYIPFVALYLAWDRRRAIMAERDAPGAGGLGSAWIGYLVLLIGLGAYLAGRAGGVQLALRVSLIVVLFGLAIYLGGWRVARLLAFPIAFLAVMIPPPAAVLQQLTWPLQLFTARFSTEALRALGYPVLLQGVYIDLPMLRVEVAEACSGFRSLIALGATGLLLAYLTQSKPLNRLLLVAAVIPIAIIANAIRVTWIIVMGARDPSFLEGPLHAGSGLVVFVIAAALLIGLATMLARWPRPVMPRMSGEPA